MSAHEFAKRVAIVVDDDAGDQLRVADRGGDIELPPS